MAGTQVSGGGLQRMNSTSSYDLFMIPIHLIIINTNWSDQSRDHLLAGEVRHLYPCKECYSLAALSTS